MAPRMPTRATLRHSLLRLRLRAWPILQTAAAAVAAWYLAKLLLSEDEPVFASIAAVISVGATVGQRRQRAAELVGGVVVGIGVADLLVQAIGSGGWQLGVMVVLAMSAAVMVGGGPMLVTEAAVSAILLVLLEPSSTGLPPSRLLEALVGGGVALAVSALFFPPDPVILVGRSTQAIFGSLGSTLEDVARALSEGDEERSRAALESARGIDDELRELDEALSIGHEMARFVPGRRSTRGDIARYSRSARHVDYAIRNTRVLARHVARFLRSGGAAPDELSEAVHELARAVWALAVELDAPTGGADVRRHAARAASRATESFEGHRELGLAEIVAQVRSTAIDLVRAAESARDGGEPPDEIPTEEFLIGTDAEVHAR